MSYAYAVFDSLKNTYTNWGLMLESVSIPLPEPQIISVDIPGMNGCLDLSDTLTGDISYNNRPATLVFSVFNTYDDWAALISLVSNYLHGKKRKMVLDIDTGFYYYGRFTVDTSKSDEVLSTIAIKGTVDPYKYELNPTVVTRAVSSSASVTLTGLRMPVVPVINSTAVMTVTYGGTVYNLAIGNNTIPGINLVEGSNTLLFTGTGTVTITYQRGQF